MSDEAVGGVRELDARAPVVEVTLLEDRAVVLRRGQVELPPGRSRLVIDQVAPVLVDKTLAAALALPEGVEGELPEDLRVSSATVERRRVVLDSDRPAGVAEIRATRRAKLAEIEAIERRRERLAEEHESLQALIELSLAEITEDVGWGRQDRGRWASELDQLETRLQAVLLAAREAAHEKRLGQRDLGDLATLEAASATLESVARASLTLEFFNPTERTWTLDLRVNYLVPGALWRPWHTARLIESDAGARISFACAGAVWQNTGEDWRDVQLIFSTDRPSLGVTPPELTTDRLSYRKKSSTVEVQARDQKVHTAGLGADDGPAKEVAEDELPGIDDGGEAIELRGRAKATVPSDGRPYRVPIFEFEAPAEVQLLCVPELVPAVILRSRQANAGAHPILAGPVDLVRNSGLVGRSSLLYVAPGERFELGWGPDSSLRVHREVEQLEHERRMMSSWTRKPRRVTLRLSNLGPTPKTVEVQERIAVSEVEKVEVEVSEASQGAKPNDEGFVTWNLKLPGFGRDELGLTWVLVVHDDVVGL